MIDLHCHILSGIDDGAKDFEMSLKMCDIARKNRINHIVATPHITAVSDIDYFIETRDKELDRLQKAVDEVGMNVSLYPGAEVFLDDDVFYAKDLQRLTINNSRYLLVEFSFQEKKVSRVVDYLNAIVDMNLTPIFAHPERYQFFQYDYDAVNALADSGVIFQINASSLASLDGPEEFELAYAMAYSGTASIMGTDAHSTRFRANDMMKMMEYFPPDISQMYMQRMVFEVPQNILKDEPIHRVERTDIRKKGFRY